MAIINMNNYGTVRGRLTRDPKVITNNGGTTYLFTVAVDRGYTDSQGRKVADFVPFRGFVADGKKIGAYSYLTKGKEVEVGYEVESYTQMVNGQVRYGISLNVVPGGIKLGASARNSDSDDEVGYQPTRTKSNDQALNDAINKIKNAKDDLDLDI